MPEGGEEIFRRLVGCKIIRIGSAADADLEGGGLIIDYSIANSALEHRLVFAFNELGMWLLWDSMEAYRAHWSERCLSAQEIEMLFR